MGLSNGNRSLQSGGLKTKTVGSTEEYWWVGTTIPQNLQLWIVFTRNDQEIRLVCFKAVLFTSMAALQQQRLLELSVMLSVSAKSKQKRQTSPIRRTTTLGKGKNFEVLLFRLAYSARSETDRKRKIMLLITKTTWHISFDDSAA